MDEYTFTYVIIKILFPFPLASVARASKLFRKFRGKIEFQHFVSESEAHLPLDAIHCIYCLLACSLQLDSSNISLANIFIAIPSAMISF